MTAQLPFRLGVFTRLVDEVPPPELYARALELLTTAEELGFASGWVAQHHAHQEGGLPAPLGFLAAAAARTERLRLGTGIITLPLEDPLRLAEDAAVLDALSGGRLELGFGTGGGATAFALFGRSPEGRRERYAQSLRTVRDALGGARLIPGGPPLFPPAPGLTGRLWEATFGRAGAVRAAERGNGLLLARTSAGPAPDSRPSPTAAPLGDVQLPLAQAYLDRWRHPGADTAPRIGLSRSVYVAPTRAEAVADAEAGLARYAAQAGPEAARAARNDTCAGTPDEVLAALRADRTLPLATDLILQVHPVDPGHERTLRSLRLFAAEVAPGLCGDEAPPAAGAPSGRASGGAGTGGDGREREGGRTPGNGGGVPGRGGAPGGEGASGGRGACAERPS
ncbi:LLM class flavin-dependent oxidoreductase [Streptomyces sp. RS10V-4]|uniref:LLM class flavin-dependent oxidoreductase n=1 Tax=Streptomyces rhizoryzae TaxID=2932493 RepID=UPI002006C589|nr:LLM class flavin-dependent oxidoreductase [Streptomyces rhizoryzae]MCK7622543.1 LLM class flavin-dependent oxidoreductase [Streptomyces rhizoryzae]